MLGSQHFNDLRKTAYSHGLESLYSIENIDLRTIRRLQDNPLEPAVAPKKNYKTLKKSPQLELDFGISFRTWIKPFFPLESIRVLGLSKYAEKALLEQGKLKIGDLLHLSELKGLGQGHLVEIRDKVEEYVAERDTEQTETIDFAAWLRALFAVHEIKKVYPLFEKYQLQNLIAITAAESVEIKRLNAEQREERCREVLAEVDRGLLEEGARAITAAFLLPWIADREGIAAQEEIEERLERISDEVEVALKVLKLLNRSFGHGFFFGTYLTPFTGDLYAIDPTYANYGKILLKCASTYFYNPQVFYPFKTLVSLLKRELACHWIALPDSLIEKLLFTAPQFRLSKNFRGELLVYSSQKSF